VEVALISNKNKIFLQNDESNTNIIPVKKIDKVNVQIFSRPQIKFSMLVNLNKLYISICEPSEAMNFIKTILFKNLIHKNIYSIVTLNRIFVGKH
jgi:hypothetical protein